MEKKFYRVFITDSHDGDWLDFHVEMSEAEKESVNTRLQKLHETPSPKVIMFAIEEWKPDNITRLTNWLDWNEKE